MTDPRPPQGWQPPAAPQGQHGQPMPQGQPGQQAGEQGTSAQLAKARELVDGEWHRLHPATPLLRGGLALIVVAGILINSFRDSLVNLLVPDEYEYGDYDPVEMAWTSGVLGWIVLGILGVILLCVGGFWLSWRVHRFRITGDVVEVEQGILFRKHRRAPLARIQGINITKPWFARLFGACKLEVQQAGADSNVDLSYLSASIADALRYEILGRAGGRTQQQRDADAAQRSARGQHSVVDDFLHPDAELADVAHGSLVRIPPGRIVLSSILESGVLIWLPLLAIASIVLVVTTGQWFLLFSLIPGAFAVVAYGIRVLGQKLRYSIAATRDGIRLAYGLASTTTEILPPGRVFSMTVSQPLLWRPFGWWKIAFTRAGKTDASGGNQQQQQRMNTLLPIGTRDDVETVLRLVVPSMAGSPLVGSGIEQSGPDTGFVISPARARVFRWFSRRRNGLAITPDAFLLRKGAIWRSLTIVPLARTQSFAMQQGPLYGMAGLARLVLHVVGATVAPSIGALDAADVQRAFAYARDSVPQAIGKDSAESWGVSGGEAGAPTPTSDHSVPQRASPPPQSAPQAAAPQWSPQPQSPPQLPQHAQQQQQSAPQQSPPRAPQRIAPQGEPGYGPPPPYGPPAPAPPRQDPPPTARPPGQQVPDQAPPEQRGGPSLPPPSGPPLPPPEGR